MASMHDPMLFLPPQPPLPLRPGAKVVVGRSRSCDLRLPSGDASRRHAEVEREGESTLIRDLASTNGTFVNGERIEERKLRPGDRIQIGADTITYCQVGSSAEIVTGPVDTGEAKTILVERPALAEAEVLQGELSDVPPFAVLQILEMGRMTGQLTVEADQAVGRLWLRDGAPVHAETKDQRGFDAALALVNASSGHFKFEPQASLPDPTIAASVTELLLEASRLLDEGRL